MAKFRARYLHKRGEIYYFRIAIPKALRQRFGRQEIKVSLQTRDFRAAKLRCGWCAAVYEQLLEKVEGMPGITREKLNELVKKHFEQRSVLANEFVSFADDPTAYDVEHEVSLAERDIASQREGIAKRQYDASTRAKARELLESIGVGKLNDKSEEFEALCHGILRAEAELTRIYAEKLQGRYDCILPRDPIVAGMVTDELPPIPGETVEPSNDTVAVFANRYYEFKAAHVWASKTAVENRRALDWFCEVAGPDRDGRTLSTGDVKAFRDILLKLPPNHAKLKEFAGMTLASVAKKYTGESTLSASSAQKYFANIRAFLKWLVDEEYLDKMPGSKIKLGIPVHNQDARHPFSKAQLQAIFASPQFTGHASPAQRSKKGTFLVRDAKYWIPFIGLYSGMRLGEIVQLLTTDVKEDDGTLYFDVSKDEVAGKSLKTASSVRKVPVHPTLVDIGFLKHVEIRRGKSPNGRLFEEVQPGKNGSYSHNFSKWFSRYLKQVNVKTPKISFHSYRHNFKDALVIAGVEDSHIKALLGHADLSVTAGYGSKLPPQVLKKDIEKVSYVLEL